MVSKNVPDFANFNHHPQALHLQSELLSRAYLDPFDVLNLLVSYVLHYRPWLWRDGGNRVRFYCFSNSVMIRDGSRAELEQSRAEQEQCSRCLDPIRSDLKVLMFEVRQCSVRGLANRSEQVSGMFEFRIE